VVDAIRDRFVAGVTLAEEDYEFSSGDEDSVTGALGQSVRQRPVAFQSGDGSPWIWSTSYYKLRGRGPGAPEKHTGADGIFQIHVQSESGQVIRMKGLPFQSKKNWRGTNKKLADQAEGLLSSCGDGIVIDFTKSGYYAAHVEAVAYARGSRPKVAQGSKLPSLAKTLSDFVECTIGKRGLYYDPGSEQFVKLTAPPAVTHVIDTQVSRVDLSRA
jgi:hypothetical protein